MRDKNLPQSYGNRFLAMYNSELREFEREVSREKISDEIELKSKTQETQSPETIALNKAIVEGITRMQERKDG